MQRFTRAALIAASIAGLSSYTIRKAQAAAFAPGDLVVLQVGADGSSTALAAPATAGFLKEFIPVLPAQVAPVQTIALPTAASGAQDAMTFTGNSTSEGFLTLSSNSSYLLAGGYNVALGGTTTTSTGRVIGRIDLSGNVDTSTFMNDPANGNIRSVTSSDGTNIWSGTSSGGVHYTTFGSTAASTQLNTTAPTNARVVNIFGGQLYTSSASAPFLGVATMGAGLPTTAGQTATLLSGFPTAGTHSSYDYYFANANTVYVADDGSTASGGGIQKWTQSGGTWSLAYTLLNSGTSTTPVRGLAGAVDINGNTVLFGTTGTTLIGVIDTGAASGAITLATAPANTAFRGVEFIPGPLGVVPEPCSLTLAALALAGLSGRGRRSSRK